MPSIHQFIGAAGLIAISIGVLLRIRRTQNLLYVFGGIALTWYSIALHDIIFILLQLVFISAALYDLFHLRS